MRRILETDFLTYMHKLPASASFTGKGFFGYTFGPLHNKNVEILYIESETGHDTFFISKKLTRFYYVLAGTGYFTMNGARYEVSPEMLIEVPPKVEYTYSGKMSMIALGTPGWIRGNETTTRRNPDVISRDMSLEEGTKSWLTRLVRFRVLGKSPVGGYLRLNQYAWNALPSFFTALGPIRAYGNFLHSLARIQIVRARAFSTYFIRNRAELELIRRLIDHRRKADIVKVAVLGCSTGAEAYSVAWKIRSARPDVQLVMHAVDISRQAVEFAKRGVYSLTTPQLTDTSICSAMTAAEMGEMLRRDERAVTIEPWIKEGIDWQVGDAGDPEIVEALGPQDMVVANNFLCHRDDAEAERCLRVIARLVRPGGYLFVSGIDLDVRTKVASDLRWEPVQELLEDVHEGDRALAARWPCHYEALEPLNKKRRDWRLRYAAAYQLVPRTRMPITRTEDEASGSMRTVGAGPGVS